MMDGTNPRYHPRHLAPAAAANRSPPNPAPRPERLLPNPAATPSRTTPTPDRFLLSPNPWSSLSAGQPAKPKPGPATTPSLPQPPGGSCYGYPHLSSRVTDLKALLHGPSAGNAAGAGAGIGLARPHSTALGAAAPPLPRYPRHGLSAGSSVGQQSPLGALFMNNKSSNAQGALPGEGSASGIDGVPQGAAQFQDPGVHAMQKLASKPPPRHRQPALPGDRIRVSCLNVGGEFFMGEAGLFGILCSCHQLRMSVAKFCEHAGGPAEKAGEIVLMENGMSIAYWFKYCVGVCVICGYGGGAMTRALNAQKILRSSLKGLRVTTWSDKNVKHNSFYASKSRSLGSIPGVDKQKSIGSAHEDNTVRSSWTANHNSSLLGPKTMQWIHVVCGLWTPGTKCPNSTTMNAFDISGALPGKRNNGFKGRKGEGCYGSNYKEPRVKSNECSVPQEQIDAWLRINGSKPCIRRQRDVKVRCILLCQLVIEYVGEIVGQRVADKRELEYHSGKRQQYKSVCYFFKIDKEHIIDATRKGGIARFINHSCLIKEYASRSSHYESNACDLNDTAAPSSAYGSTAAHR
ncbi:hypothetical protein ACQ4PT_009526 [Festuca glaucescens]